MREADRVMAAVRSGSARPGVPHLLAGVGAVVAQNQVGPAAVQQQVGGLEGQLEGLDGPAEVQAVPQDVPVRVHEQILKEKKKKKRGRR